MSRDGSPLPAVPGALGRTPEAPLPAGPWLRTLRRYLLCVIAANLVWEFAHLPLYTLWRSASAGELIFAALHCTAGDALIATATLVLALLLLGNAQWPRDRAVYRRVAVLTLLSGLAYTVFSEWLNVTVREAWTYSPHMPVLPWIGTGLSPVLQWLLIPVVAFWWAVRPPQARGS